MCVVDACVIIINQLANYYFQLNMLCVFLSVSKNSHKRIILFTNNDNPHRTNPSLQVYYALS